MRLLRRYLYLACLVFCLTGPAFGQTNTNTFNYADPSLPPAGTTDAGWWFWIGFVVGFGQAGTAFVFKIVRQSAKQGGYEF